MLLFQNQYPRLTLQSRLTQAFYSTMNFKLLAYSDMITLY